MTVCCKMGSNDDDYDPWRNFINDNKNVFYEWVADLPVKAVLSWGMNKITSQPKFNYRGRIIGQKQIMYQLAKDYGYTIIPGNSFNLDGLRKICERQPGKTFEQAWEELNGFEKAVIDTVMDQLEIW